MNKVTEEEIKCFEQAYMALLRLPPTGVRLFSQHLLCSLRDALVVVKHSDPQTVQEYYEDLVAKEKQ